MIDLLFASVLLIMAAAIVVLFAMLGELATRLPQPAVERGSTLKPIDGARIGHVSSWWPPQLSRLNDAKDGVLLVLSSACASCEGIGQQLQQGADLPDSEFGILVSCGNKDSGQDFIARHKLERFGFYIDKGGEWVRSEFNVMMSPSALFFNEGRLETALVFDDLKMLRKAGSDSQLPARVPRSAPV